jgi:hypothetical protein
MSERDPHLGEPFDDDAPESAPPAEYEVSGSPAGSEEGGEAVAQPAGSAAASVPASAVGEPAAPASGAGRPAHEVTPNMLPGRPSRGSGLERGVVRMVATGGVIGIGVGIAAILASQHVQGWIIGLVVSTLSVILSAVLWSSRQL